LKRKFDTYRYLLQTLDPVHIGTGGMRLGGVDNTIVRETGTNLPKIPGSSLKGVIRTYAAHQADSIECAGSKKHCKDNNCPICYTFGTGETNAGVAGFADARILLFPVHSMKGPVWISSPLTLLDASLVAEYEDIPNDVIVRVGFDNSSTEEASEQREERINLNWLMLNLDTSRSVQVKGTIPIPLYIKERVYLVSEATFSQVVNSNLEVRTSVSIDPKTGTAEEGALFTYEAIPRVCILWVDIILNMIAKEKVPEPEPKTTIDNAIKWLKDLGIGGMGSRGFGRVSMFEWK
jgi:CRISPR-associated protein Cmr4